MPEAANVRDIVLLVDDSPEALGFLTEALEQFRLFRIDRDLRQRGAQHRRSASRRTSSCSMRSCPAWMVSTLAPG